MIEEFFGSDFQVMRADIKEREGQYLIEIELPGFKRNNIKAELSNGYLTIIAKRDPAIENDDMKTHYILKERKEGEIKRSFPVGLDIKEENISAAYKDGILSVIIAKSESKIEADKIKLIPID